MAWLRFAGFGALAIVAGVAAATAATGGCGLPRSGSQPEGSSTSTTGAGGDNGCPQCAQGKGECQMPTCNDGCALLNLQAGTVCMEDGGNVCDGDGDCVECTSEAQCPGNELVCQLNECVPIACVNMTLDRGETDVDCGGPCAPCSNGDGCALAEDCISGFCDTQGGGGAGGSDALGTCAPCASHADCAPEAWCDGTVDGGTCTADKPLGNPCVDAAECESTSCADLFCCDTACGDGCDRCDVTVGTCTAYLDGEAGDGTCAPYLCNGSLATCPLGCADDSDCVAVGYCDMGTLLCEPLKLVQGSACDYANECDTGFCVDGFCCDALCDGACQACANALTVDPAADGTCGNVLQFQEDGLLCTGVNSCDGMGNCKKDTGQSCPTTMDSECTSNFCRDGFCCESNCNTTCRACSMALSQAASNGLCRNMKQFVDDLFPAAACTGTETCDAGGNCEGKNGQSCAVATAATDCASGNCPADDLVCCNMACAGLCQGCTDAKTEALVDGQCADITVNTDPDEDCLGSGDNECCNGMAMCGGTDPSCDIPGVP